MLHAAILGLGRWGRRLVESVQPESQEIRFVAAVTGRRDPAIDFARQHRMSLFDTLDHLIESGLPQAIVIATPHSQHHRQILQCLDAGLPVFVEKPVVLSTKEMEDVEEIQARTGLLVAAGHNRRFLPAFTDLRASVRAGQIGEILHLEGHLSASAGYAYRDGNWRTDPLESPAGGLAGAGIHVVDLMVALSGGARQVFAQADRRAISATMDDTTSALIKFRSGSSGYVAAVTATAPTFQFRVFGSKGMIALNGENGLERVELDGTRSLQLFGARDIERLELESFARCCRGEELYPIDLPEVRNGIAIFEAISLSARSQAPVEVRP